MCAYNEAKNIETKLRKPGIYFPARFLVLGMVVLVWKGSPPVPDITEVAAPESSKISGRPAAHGGQPESMNEIYPRIKGPGDGLILMLCKPAFLMFACCISGSGSPGAGTPKGMAAFCICLNPFGSGPGHLEGSSSTSSNRAVPKQRISCDQWFGLDLA